MSERLMADTFVPWLAQEAHRLAQATVAGGDPFPYLWGVAIDALDWLRYAPLEEREKAIRSVKQFLDTGTVGNVLTPVDEHEQECLTTLMRWIIYPPRVI